MSDRFDANTFDDCVIEFLIGAISLRMIGTRVQMLDPMTGQEL